MFNGRLKLRQSWLDATLFQVNLIATNLNRDATAGSQWTGLLLWKLIPPIRRCRMRMGITEFKNTTSDQVHSGRNAGKESSARACDHGSKLIWGVFVGKNREVRGRRLSGPSWILELYYIGRLKPLRAPDDFELDGRAFLEATVTFSLDRRKVDENILATLPLDKTIPFARVEPLYGSLLTIVTHVYFCSLIDSWRRQFCTSLPGLKNTNSRNLPPQPLSTTRKGYKSDKRSLIVP